MRKPNQLTPEEELKHLKNVVKVIMNDAIKVLAEIELLYEGETEIENKISRLDHYLNYAIRLCEDKKQMNEL